MELSENPTAVTAVQRGGSFRCCIKNGLPAGNMLLFPPVNDPSPMPLIPSPCRVLIYCLCYWSAVSHALAYNTLGPIWPQGSTIVMQLELGPSSVLLEDGSGTWNGSAANALAAWNPYMEVVQFDSVSDSQAPKAPDDGVNSVFFSNSVYGEGFGEDALAITLLFYDENQNLAAVEADVIVNNAFQYNSYRGPLKPGDPETRVYDIHRVFLHEFGHILGLAHPDEIGELVVAIMNSVVTDLDHLADDDIDGAVYLYGIKLFSGGESLRVGQPVNYQLSTNVPGVSYEATDLPPGLVLNSKTGVITGALSLSGRYDTAMATVHGLRTSVTNTLVFTASPDPPLNLRASFYWKANRVVMDESRHRAYVTISSPPSVAVLDTETLSLIKTIPTETEPFGMTISLDGKKLYVAQYKETDPGLIVIDLASFATLPSIPTPFRTFDIAAGSNNRLFITQLSSAGIAQIDATTGSVLAPFATNESLDGRLKISADLKTLFVAAVNYGPPYVFAVDVSGDTPVVLQQTPFNDYLGGIGDFKLSHDESFLCVPNDAIGAVKKLSSTDFTPPLGEFFVPNFGIGGEGATSGRAVEISPDDSTVFVTDLPGTFLGAASIDLFDSVTRKYLRSVDMPGFTPDSFTLDPNGQYLFAPSKDPQQVPQLRVYATGLPAPALHPPKPASLLNVSTRLQAQTGDNVPIGGFIISGKELKQVAVRGIGPSLPLDGAFADPMLSLYDGDGKLVASNENWNSTRASLLATGLAPTDEHEAAIVVNLAPGNYTAILSGMDNSSGVALVEVYDLTPDSDSAVANISTRGDVESGDNVMIGGFIIGADTPTEVLIRAIGPSLTQYGVAGALQDPVLELHGSDGEIIFSNDNWRSTQKSEITATGLAPTDDRESAILATLQPGSYTAIVRGQNSSTGVGLVEVYNLDAAAATSE